MNHQYVDVSNLNAIWDDVPLQGLGSGVLSSPSGIGVLGIGVTSGDVTTAAQTQYNTWAKGAGYCPITVDGKMGPVTCGALKTYVEQTGKGTIPSTCTSFTAPKVCAPSTPLKAGFSGGDSTWIIVGGVVAASAIGAALYFTRKGR